MEARWESKANQEKFDFLVLIPMAQENAAGAERVISAAHDLKHQIHRELAANRAGNFRQPCVLIVEMTNPRWIS